jgi:ATP-dependent DNA helicase RecQ
MCDICGAVPGWMESLEGFEEQPKRKRKRAQLPPEPQPAPAPAPRKEPAAVPPQQPADMLEYLREWRRKVAQRHGVPAFMILHDTSLEDLVRKNPTNLHELLQVSGIGERKAEIYGAEIFAALESFRHGGRASSAPVMTASPAEETLRLLAEGKSFEEIARIRNRQLPTVVGMVADLVEKGRLEYKIEWVGEEAHCQIEEAAARLGVQWLKPLRQVLPDSITDEQIRLVVACLRRRAR